jgi:hypothetical protein
MSIKEKNVRIREIGTQIREKLGNLEKTKTTFYSKKTNNFIQLMIFLVAFGLF